MIAGNSSCCCCPPDCTTCDDTKHPTEYPIGDPKRDDWDAAVAGLGPDEFAFYIDKITLPCKPACLNGITKIFAEHLEGQTFVLPLTFSEENEISPGDPISKRFTWFLDITALNPLLIFPINCTNDEPCFTASYLFNELWCESGPSGVGNRNFNDVNQPLCDHDYYYFTPAPSGPVGLAVTRIWESANHNAPGREFDGWKWGIVIKHEDKINEGPTGIAGQCHDAQPGGGTTATIHGESAAIPTCENTPCQDAGQGSQGLSLVGDWFPRGWAWFNLQTQTPAEGGPDIPFSLAQFHYDYQALDCPDPWHAQFAGSQYMEHDPPTVLNHTSIALLSQPDEMVTAGKRLGNPEGKHCLYYEWIDDVNDPDWDYGFEHCQPEPQPNTGIANRGLGLAMSTSLYSDWVIPNLDECAVVNNKRKLTPCTGDTGNTYVVDFDSHPLGIPADGTTIHIPYSVSPDEQSVCFSVEITDDAPTITFTSTWGTIIEGCSSGTCRPGTYDVYECANPTIPLYEMFTFESLADDQGIEWTANPPGGVVIGEPYFVKSSAGSYVSGHINTADEFDLINCPEGANLCIEVDDGGTSTQRFFWEDGVNPHPAPQVGEIYTSTWWSGCGTVTATNPTTANNCGDVGDMAPDWDPTEGPVQPFSCDIEVFDPGSFVTYELDLNGHTAPVAGQYIESKAYACDFGMQFCSEVGTVSACSGGGGIPRRVMIAGPFNNPTCT